MAPTYRLVLRTGQPEGVVYPLEKSEMFVGRDLGNEIVINDPEVSRRHARIFLQGANYVIEDLGSTNGTSVNGQRLMGPYMLRPGEMVTFGEHINLLYEATSGSEQTVVSGSGYPQATHRAVTPPAPVYTPPPPPISQPVYTPPPPPPPVYAGQVPAKPEKKGFPGWLLILLILGLLLVCVCGAVAYFMPTEWWCAIGGGWIFDATACPQVPVP